MKAVLVFLLLLGAACSSAPLDVQAAGPAEPLSPPVASGPAPVEPTPAPEPTPEPTVAPAPSVTQSGSPQLLAASITRSDCPNGVCTYVEIWSDGMVRTSSSGNGVVDVRVASRADLEALVSAIEAFPTELTGFVRGGTNLLCRPEIDDGGRQDRILRDGRLEIVDSCHVEGPEVDDLFGAVSTAASSPFADADAPRPLADIETFGGCRICPSETVWTDGRWARWVFETETITYQVTVGLAADAAAALAGLLATTDLDALRSELRPGECYACVDGINRDVDFHVSGSIVSFSDVTYDLAGVPLFERLFDIVDNEELGLPFATISELNTAETEPGRYETAGYLAFADDCGFCPEGAACEPCGPGPVFSVLSERTDVQFVVEGGAEAFTEQLGPTELALSVNLENEHELVVGSRYEMTVELTDRVVDDAGNRVAEVIWFRELS